jgi:hypothetical protein
MSYLNKHDKIREQANSFRLESPEGSWAKIESKLAKDKINSKKKKLRILKFVTTIAASAALVIAFFSIVYFESSQIQINQKAQVEDWEELDIKDDYFYSIQNARKTNLLFPTYLMDFKSGSLEGTSSFPDVFRNDPI